MEDLLIVECQCCEEVVFADDVEDGVCFGCLDKKHKQSEKTYG